MFDIKRPRWVIAATIALLAGLFAVPALAQTDTPECIVQDPPSTEQIVDGVTLEWTSSFLCTDAPSEGERTYEINGFVTNDSGSASSVNLEKLELFHVTPPWASGTAESNDFGDSGVTLDPGQTLEFTVTGEYTLAETDEGMKANLHLQVAGDVDEVEDGDFSLGINVHIRAPGATEDGGDGGDGNDGDDDNGNGRPDNPGPPFEAPPTGNDAAAPDQVGDTQVLDTEVQATDESLEENDGDEGLDAAIAELEKQIPGDANDTVRPAVKTMLEFIAGNGDGDDTQAACVADDPKAPGAFGRAVADCAERIPDPSDDDDDNNDGGGDVGTQGGPPTGIPAGRP